MHKSPSSSSLVQSPRKVSQKRWQIKAVMIPIISMSYFYCFQNMMMTMCKVVSNMAASVILTFCFTSQGFKPSKLLFGDARNESKEQKKTAPSSLTAAQQERPADYKPQTSILAAIESCGGFSGALVTVQCVVQRVYCKKAQVSKDKTTNYRFKRKNSLT